MVGDWADGMVSKRKIFIEQDARMAMARAVLRQSSTAGGRLFVEQKRGLGTLRAYDDLIRESADAIQLRAGNEAALERFVLMVLDTDHPHSCIGSYKFEASRVTAENIGAAVFLHVDRKDRLQPRRQKTKTHAPPAPLLPVGEHAEQSDRVAARSPTQRALFTGE